MKYRAFGKTGLTVSEVSLGGLFFGKLDGGRDIHKTLAKAVDVGINLIDTAAAYTGSEAALGEALKGGLREKFILATKWWPYKDDNRGIKTAPADLRAAVEGSLARLQTDRVELFMFHSITHPGDIETLSQEGIQSELGKLKKEGKIRFVGLSNEGKWDPDDSRLVEAIHSGLFDFVMPELLLFRQGAVKNLLPLAAAKKTGVISIIPLGQAAWGSGLRDRTTLKASIENYVKKGYLDGARFPDPGSAVDFLLDEKTRTIAAAALRFCLSFPGVSTVCCGTNDPAHIAENAAISDLGPYDAARLAKAEELFGKLTHNPE
jgi:aryl-alcohol dehydrogenase-like predicted oxidoreductase